MTHQFDVFPNPSRRGLEERPYLVAIQSPFWDEMATRICVPLIDERFIRPQGRLNPSFEISGRALYFHPLEMLSVPTRLLRRPVANLEEFRYHIIAALDLVFLGI
jgi:toxin CcdB